MRSERGETAAPTWLVRAKVHPARTAVDQVSRLSSLLAENPEFVTLIEASAGYGKTTLLSQLRGNWLERDGARSLRLTLSPDETGRSFVEYLAFALVRAGASVPADFFEGLAENSTLHKHLNILANVLEQEGGDWLIILVDLEVIDADICKPVEYLIGVAPQNLRFLLAGRQNPGLALSRYAAQSQLLHVRADQLSFSAQQILALYGERISLDQAVAVQQATLGWPIAVQLMNMDLKAGRSLEDALRRLGDPSETTAQYIREQIEDRLPEALRTMLLKASVLDWLEADALRATQGSDNLLDHLNDLGEVAALISPIGEDTETYRIHPLLREYLQENLRRDRPDDFKALHKATARWMSGKNRFRHALSHAYQSGDEGLIGRVIEDFGAVRLFIQEGVTRAFSSHVYLNDRILRDFPRVALMHCVIQTKRGQLKEARAVYESMTGLTEGFTRDRAGGSDEALQLDHRFCLPFLVLYGTLPMEFLRQSDLDQMPDGMGDSALVDGAYNNTLCVSNFVKGHLNEAARRIDRARRAYREAASLYGQLYIDLHGGAIAANQGRPEEAQSLYERARITQRRTFREDEGARLACDVMQAELWLFQGNFTALDKVLPSLARRLTELEAWRDIYANAASTAVDYLLVRGRFTELRSFLRDLHHYLREEQLTDLFPMLSRLEYLAEAALQAQEKGMPRPFGDEALPGADSILTSLSYWGCRDSESVTKAHYQLQQIAGQPMAPEGLAGQVADHFLSKGLMLPACRVLITAACSDWSVGRVRTAVGLAETAVSLLRNQTGHGLVLLHADILAGMLEGGEGVALSADSGLWLRGLLADEEEKAAKPLFSPRERDVLEHLLDGKQDKVIARELGVTEHAVRYHLKNIYARIQVSSRHEAVSYIRDRKLLA
jgi:LuxR family maltose regulon positive regulatory protein